MFAKDGKILAQMNKEVLSRRAFFRKAALKVIPLLGLLSIIPIFSIAQDTITTSCKYSCKGNCNRTCLGCCYQSPCKGGCKHSSRGMCDTCSSKCMGTAKGTRKVHSNSISK